VEEAPAEPAVATIARVLDGLRSLRDAGVISDEEHEDIRARVLRATSRDRDEPKQEA
jgi:hypothetical protein